jgi:hypothetical protein
MSDEVIGQKDDEFERWLKGHRRRLKKAMRELAKAFAALSEEEQRVASRRIHDEMIAGIREMPIIPLKGPD